MKTAQIKKKNFGLAITALLLCAGPVHSAENYPSKPIRLIVPFAAAGSIDVVARPIAQSLSDLLGQQVVVDNRGAGGGNCRLGPRRQGAVRRLHAAADEYSFRNHAEPRPQHALCCT